MTTRNEIIDWLHRGKEKGATHVVVACDTFDNGDFPVFVMPGEDARKIAEENNNAAKMLRLMEVYNLSLDWDTQLNQRRSFNY